MTLPNDERLWLTVCRDVEVECDVCKGTGIKDERYDEHNCWGCKGTGRIAQRLTGAVEVHEPFPFRMGLPTVLSNPVERRYQIINSEGEFRQFIVEHFLAGTLPDELLYHEDKRPWGLRLVEVE